MASLFAVLFGCFLGLALLKFGNPPMMDSARIQRAVFDTQSGSGNPAQIYSEDMPGLGQAPAWGNSAAADIPPAASFWERVWRLLLAFPWPISWAYGALGGLVILGAFVARWKTGVRPWLMGLPLVWLAWQCLAASQSVAPRLSWPTLAHFAACMACFYVGLLCLSRFSIPALFSVGLLCGFALVLAVGLDQHFGGLAQYRQYTLRQMYLYPAATHFSPAFLRKVASTRIFSTLFYPNSLAGILLLLLPGSLVWICNLRDRLASASRAEVIAVLAVIALASAWLYVTGSGAGLAWFLVISLALVLRAPRWILIGLMALAGLACLYWSGSKGGWLLMLGIGLLALLRLKFPARLKTGLVLAALLIGLSAFFVKYSSFFKKGATSVSARFDYWRAAVQTVSERPVFGTGPGTFAIAYARVKRPESEFARMAHNDYLEQASDSGVAGFIAYGVFIAAALVLAYKRSRSWPVFAVWIGVLGWSLQEFFEFGLYLPSLSWPAFALLGWLLAREQGGGVETLKR